MTTAVDAPTTPTVEPAAATLPALLLGHAAARPRDPALRVKRLGRWLEISWQEYATRAANVALGLRGALPQGLSTLYR